MCIKTLAIIAIEISAFILGGLTGVHYLSQKCEEKIESIYDYFASKGMS